MGLAEFGEGFILCCFQHYGANQAGLEAFINDFLMESLPASLKSLDKKMGRKGFLSRRKAAVAATASSPSSGSGSGSGAKKVTTAQKKKKQKQNRALRKEDEEFDLFLQKACTLEESEGNDMMKGMFYFFNFFFLN